MLAHAKFDREPLPQDLLAARSAHGVERHSLYVVLRRGLQVFLATIPAKKLLSMMLASVNSSVNLPLMAHLEQHRCVPVGPSTCLFCFRLAPNQSA